jgi:hypothetical protein
VPQDMRCAAATKSRWGVCGGDFSRARLIGRRVGTVRAAFAFCAPIQVFVLVKGGKMNVSLHVLGDNDADWNASCDARQYYPVRVETPPHRSMSKP